MLPIARAMFLAPPKWLFSSGAFVDCGAASGHFSIFDRRICYCQPASLCLTRHLLVAPPPLFDSFSIIVVCHIAIPPLAGALISLSPFLNLAYKLISSCTISYCLAGTFVECCAAIYLIWLAYNQLPSCHGSIFQASLFIAVLPFHIWLAHFWLPCHHICIWLVPLLVTTLQHLH